MKEEIELCFIPNSNYIHNMNSQKGKSNIFYEIETSNKFDNQAIQIFTLNQKKEKIFLGYVKKNEVETIFTDEANELYENAEMFDNWEKNKLNKDWGKVKETIKTPIFKDDELQEILKAIDNKEYKFRYDYDTGYGYLFK